MPPKQTQRQTQYVKMLLASNDIPSWWGRLAHAFSWILLQGYVIFPSTFTAYDLAHLEGAPAGKSLLGDFKSELFYLIRHVPPFWIAWSAVIIGGLGMFVCLLRWRRNFVWGLREVISPGFYAASTGLVTTLVSICGTEKKGDLSASSKLTLFVTGGATVFFSILWIIYKPVLLGKAKKKHVEDVGHHGLGEHGEGQLEKKEPVEGRTTTVLGNLITSPLLLDPVY